MKIKAANVTIMVSDMNRSVNFYQSLGLTLENRWGDYYAQLTAPGIVIGLHPATDKPTGSGNISIGFTVDDFANAKAHLDQLSITATNRTEEGGQFLHFADPDGTALYFIQPKEYSR